MNHFGKFIHDAVQHEGLGEKAGNAKLREFKNMISRKYTILLPITMLIYRATLSGNMVFREHGPGNMVFREHGVARDVIGRRFERITDASNG